MDSLNLQGSTQSLNFRLRTVLPFANPGYLLFFAVTENSFFSIPQESEIMHESAMQLGIDKRSA